MTKTVISVEHLTKRYDLGVIGTGTLSRDLNRWWARIRKQPDPYTPIGQEDRFKRLGDSILALDDVSFTVQQGEALGIIGKHGAGKSTLLKILSRVTAPTRGVVKVKGRIGSLLEVGTGFHPELTGRENVFLNGAILGMRKEEVQKKFDEIVDFSGVEKFIDTPVKRYSSGMYVRLAFAVAAHLDPEILVIDEVLAVGDAEFQKKCLGKMSDVAGEGRTVLFVSHNMQAIEKLCHKAILINEGIVQQFGNVDFVVSQYLDEQFSSIYQATRDSKDSIHISRIWFSNSDGLSAENFNNGEPIVFNAIIENPKSEPFHIELSFWDKQNTKLWNFTHNHIGLPSIKKGPKATIRLTFFVPNIHVEEVFVHAGIRLPHQEGQYYVENITEGIRFFIDRDKDSTYKSQSTLFTCPVEFELIE
jgi:lipopolysaccharide transport system ATP-binding protein